MLYDMEIFLTGVSSKGYASANFTPLHVVWFSSSRGESQG